MPARKTIAETIDKMAMNRTKRAALNSLCAMMNMLVNMLVSLIVSIKILAVYGPDYHGLNSILSSVMVWLLLLEGGLTTVSTVALFKPFMAHDIDRCNSILTASRVRYFQIGCLIFAAGGILAIVYPFFIKTPIPYLEIAVIFLIMTCAKAFGIGYTRRFNVMFAVSQREYVGQLVRMSFNILGNAVVFILAVKHCNYLWTRTVYLGVELCDGLTMAWLISRQYKEFGYRHPKPDFEAVKGTGQVVVQRLTAIVRVSAVPLYISMLLGTTAASIYAVNLYGYNLIRVVTQNIMNATQSGIGQVVAEKNKEDIYKIFRVFEFIVINITLLLMSTAIVMTIPFVKYYTRGVRGVEYVNLFLWLVIPLNIAIQLFHVPSGIIMNMHARFREDKNFQLLGIGVMLPVMVAGGYLLGLNGIMIGVTCGSVTLAVCELWYARSRIFSGGYFDFFRPLLVNIPLLGVVSWGELQVVPRTVTLPQFFLYGFAVFLIHALVMLTADLLFERERCLLAMNRVRQMFFKSPKKA